MGWLIAAALILLILMLKLSIRVNLQNDVALTLGVGIFRKKILPSGEKQLKLSDFEIKNFRKNKEKQDRKSKKKSAKKVRKPQKKTVGQSKSSAGEQKQKGDIMELITRLIEVVRVLLSRLGHHLRINVKRVHIIVASEDAASTAVLYGAICGAVQCLFELLYNCMHLRLPKGEEIQVVPDFTSVKIRADIDITFSFRLWQILDTLIRSGWAYIKQKLNK